MTPERAGRSSMLKRKESERREEVLLAPYAMKSRLSKGRVHPEEEHPYRPVYQRDKDRIVYSTAFRRLEYKTQVFVNHEGDYYRTRLTHTLEVAQIARTIARVFKLNEDLVEALALAHDLGHTPFGHSGEDALRELMKEHGGFDHNSHGLRVVDHLEHVSSEYEGLNLTWEVREGIIKHSSRFDLPRAVIPFDTESSPILEVQVVDIADEIAYDNHDLDDGLTSRLIAEGDLMKIALWKESARQLRQQDPGISEEIRRHQIIRLLINRQVTDLIEETGRRIRKYRIKTPRDVQQIPHKVVVFSSQIQEKRKPLRDFLMKNLYNHYRVVRMSDKATRIIQQLFAVYAENPAQLPAHIKALVTKRVPVERVICDYIAGMTDRYALDEYKKFFDPYEKV